MIDTVRRLGFASLAILLSLLLGHAVRADEYVAKTFTAADGKTIPYRLLTPKNYDAGKSYPLVLFFHGAGERGTDNAKQLVHGTGLFLKAENREKYPCFVLAPQCPDNQQWVDMPWSGDSGKRPEKPSASMQLALGTLDAVCKEFNVDKSRIYVTGLSMGGYGTWDCVTRFPERFAAGIPICGGGDDKTITAAVAKVPVWAFHSEDDGVVKVIRTRSMIAAMKAAGGHPHYFEYFGLGHFSWGKAYDEPELLPWLFAQKLGQEDTYKLKTAAPEAPAAMRFPSEADLPAKGPWRSADWFKNVWTGRRMEFWKNRERDKGAVVFLGDSITHGWGSLARDFPGMKTANRGISGDITRGVLYRLKEDVLDLNPAAVVLLIGTNDLEDKGTPEQIAENTQLILARLKEHNPKMPVIVCKVMPSDARMRRPADKIQQINALVDEIVKADPLFVRCDTYSIFANAEGNAKKEEFPDLLHPNAAGYAKWTAALKPIFAELKLGQ